MHSIRTKTTLLTICGIIIAVVVVTVISVMFIINTQHHKSDQLLLLLCETGERNLDYYFNDVEHSIDKVATFAEDDLNGPDELKEEKAWNEGGTKRRKTNELVYCKVPRREGKK